MKKLLLFIFAFIFLAPVLSGVEAQQQQLTKNAEISVLTIAKGSSLADAFGHSAFRVKDTSGLDVVFDYGRYPFNEPNFYLKFAQGKLNYSIGGSFFNDFYNSYVRQNRQVDEQVLNLSSEEKQTLYNYLLNNYKPENREYLYDFFYDNCATKIRDVIENSNAKPITFHLPERFKAKTFRQLIRENLNLNSWGSLGIDLALGSVIDKTATAEEHMFLPAYIHPFFENATIGNNRPLVKQSQTIFKPREEKNTSSALSSPLVVFGLLAVFILYITYRNQKNRTRSKWLDVVIFTLTGLIGLGILLLWFATDHTATANNYNLLWAFVLNLFMLPQVLKTNLRPWFKRYLKLLVILLVLLTFHWITGVQAFAPTLIPLFVALAVRYLYLLKKV